MTQPFASQIIFLDILDHYDFKDDLICKFKIDKNYKSQKTDIIGLFKLGWNNVKEVLVEKSVAKAVEDERNSVVFYSKELPKESTDLYQFCYIRENKLEAVSKAFEFCNKSNDTSVDFFLHQKFSNFSSFTNLIIFAEKDKEISKLKEENEKLKEENDVLKESLKILLNYKQESTPKNCTKDIEDVRESVKNLKETILSHDKDINMLKNKIVQGSEEYRKLYLEKHRIEQNYQILKNAYTDKTSVHDDYPQNDFNLDIGDLTPIPPFPSFRHKHNE